MIEPGYDFGFERVSLRQSTIGGTTSSNLQSDLTINGLPQSRGYPNAVIAGGNGGSILFDQRSWQCFIWRRDALERSFEPRYEHS